MARPISQRYDKVRVCKEANGATASACYNKELTTRDDEDLGRIYHLVSLSTQFMLALGFFGTVWGISQKSFGNGAFGAAAGTFAGQLKLLLHNFTGALGTALDTTVLALICGLLVTALMNIMQWLETNALHDLDAGLIDVFERKLAACSEALLRSHEAALQAQIARSAELWEASLSDAVHHVLARMHTHEQQVFDTLAETLRRQTQVAVQALEEHGTHVCTALTGELQAVGQELRHAHRVRASCGKSLGCDKFHNSFLLLCRVGRGNHNRRWRQIGLRHPLHIGLADL